MLQLDLIKRHVLPKKCHKHYKTKVVNSKKIDEQLNILQYSIKNKLLETTK